MALVACAVLFSSISALAAEEPMGLDSSLLLAAALDNECAAADTQEPTSCALAALQIRTRRQVGDAAYGAEAGCHDILESERGDCMGYITWARNVSFPKHPDWYKGLDPETSSLAEWQYFSWTRSVPKCPRPCSAKADFDVSWCKGSGAPELWTPALVAEPVRVKILSYNLYWWKLFDIMGGGGAGDLIKTTGDPELYDVMGFQECDDAHSVFGPSGLLSAYTAFQSKGKCMAFRSDTWSLLEKGDTQVAEDMHTEHYGRRGAQWMRLKHNQTGMILFFVNHHGPLSVNSGGACGGVATAHNLLKVMAVNAQRGDVLILVGDFNANAASRTVQALWPHLLHVYNGPSFGGVDNIFSNLPKASIVSTSDLGTGGSDHHAISAVLALLPDDNAAAADTPTEPALSIESLATAEGSDGCLVEPNMQYVYSEGAEAAHLRDMSPRDCCNACTWQSNGTCLSWVWEEWSSAFKASLCTLRKAQPLKTATDSGFVSGLPKQMAIAKAQEASLTR